MSKSVLAKATTGLAGAVALAGGTQAYGAVVTVTVPANLATTATAGQKDDLFDVNNDGTVDFQLAVGVGGGTSASGAAYAFSLAGIYGYGGATNQVVGYTGAYGAYATRLAVGATVGSTSAFVYNSGYLTILGSRFNGKSYGALRTKGYVGFEFAAADGEHFGYIDLKATVAGTGTTDTNYTAGLTFYNASYQSTPNTPITIVAAAAPEPTSLAALAFGAAGAAGAAAYRRKKAAEQPVA